MSYRRVNPENLLLFKTFLDDVVCLQNKLSLSVFCDPYSTHQRGSNKNRIGVLRRYLPTGTDVSKLQWSYLKKIENKMNHTPIKCLN